jgi:hypothetical protein
MMPRDDVEFAVLWSGRDSLTGDYPWASSLVTAANHAVRESLQDDRPITSGHPCACGCGGFSQQGQFCRGHARRRQRNADAAHAAA